MTKESPINTLELIANMSPMYLSCNIVSKKRERRIRNKASFLLAEAFAFSRSVFQSQLTTEFKAFSSSGNIPPWLPILQFF